MKKSIAYTTLFSFLLAFLPIYALAHGITEGDRQFMLEGGNLRYLMLGANHMLTGYDHLLFIFGVIFFLTGFRDILKYITAFTAGHSITLISATLMGISANYYLVDALIALSVCYKGFENLDGFKKYFGRKAPNLLFIIFCFGLIHGFGLSTRLQQLPLGEDGLILRILSFNVGVELGQVLALTAMMAVISGWRRTQSFSRFAFISNRGLVAAGVLLFIFQMHGFGHSINLNLSGFSTESQAQTTSQNQPSDSLRRALTSYDNAFRERDVTALWNQFAEDIILYEQGTQDIGRESALGRHIGPDLQAFEQMTVIFNDVRVLEFGNVAVRTRSINIKGILPDRYFLAKGFETQNWAMQDGAWKLIHMHWSFPTG
jgi:ketosteroid isomerase-like protein/hydrogenase/urease accessory protein HupE